MYYKKADPSIIKKLKKHFETLLAEKLSNNETSYIAHSQGIYNLVIEVTNGEEIEEAYYYHLGKLKSTSINRNFLERKFLRISKSL